MSGAHIVRLGLALFLELVFFAALNFFDDWTLESMPIKFVASAFLSGAAYLAAVSSWKIEISPQKQAILFWSIAIVLRLIALPLNPGDDLYRTQWEGKIQRAGFNPYLVAPNDSQLDDLRRDFPEASKINHPELRAMDGPGAELIFRLLTGITDRALFYKILFTLADLGVAALLLRLIGGEDRYREAAWYAWNPLVAYSFAGAAHFDSIMLVALVVGILATLRSPLETESARQWLWAVLASLFFGIAISLNFVVAALGLPFIFALRGRVISLAFSAVVPAMFAAPFGFQAIRDSLGQIYNVTRLNDLFWWLIEETGWPNPHQRIFHYFPIIVIAVIFVSFLFVRDWKRGMLWALGTVLVLSPILHPWYCVWILPLAAWRGSYAWSVLSITLFGYYLFWDERLFFVPWHSPLWMHSLIIAPVMAALVMLAGKKDSPAAAM